MDIHQLELFLAVMDSAGVTKAAARMRLSPGAVSIQLHALANELHTELFRRSGKRLLPTPSAFQPGGAFEGVGPAGSANPRTV